MVSLRRHFVPNPVPPLFGQNRVEAKRRGLLSSIHTRYDGLDRRIKKHFDSQSPSNPNEIDKYEHYFYNRRWQLLETRETTMESDQPENLQPRYQHVWSLRYIDAPILRDENTDQDGLCDDERVYYLADANHNVTGMVDATGALLERYVYDAYGEVNIYNGDWSATLAASQYENTNLFTGRRFDRESGLYDYRRREYSPGLGRFLSRDPMAYTDANQHAYAYVSDDPINDVDPSGLSPSNQKLLKDCDDLLFEARKHWFYRQCNAEYLERKCGVLLESCACCRSWYSEEVPAGMYSEEKQLITVCANSKPLKDKDVEQVARILCHEMIHAMQSERCLKKEPPAGCYGKLIREIQAYYCTGECVTLPGCMRKAVGSVCETEARSLGLYRPLNWKCRCDPNNMPPAEQTDIMGRLGDYFTNLQNGTFTCFIVQPLPPVPGAP